MSSENSSEIFKEFTPAHIGSNDVAQRLRSFDKLTIPFNKAVKSVETMEKGTKIVGGVGGAALIAGATALTTAHPVQAQEMISTVVSSAKDFGISESANVGVGLTGSLIGLGKEVVVDHLLLKQKMDWKETTFNTGVGFLTFYLGADLLQRAQYILKDVDLKNLETLKNIDLDQVKALVELPSTVVGLIYMVKTTGIHKVGQQAIGAVGTGITNFRNKDAALQEQKTVEGLMQDVKSGRDKKRATARLQDLGWTHNPNKSGSILKAFRHRKEPDFVKIVQQKNSNVSRPKSQPNHAVEEDEE